VAAAVLDPAAMATPGIATLATPLRPGLHWNAPANYSGLLGAEWWLNP